MSALAAFLEGPLLDWLAVRSVEVLVLALLVAVVVRLVRRHVPPRWTYALWLLVPLRLVMPVSPTAPWSVYGLLPDWSSAPAAVATLPPADYPDLDAFTRRAAPSAPAAPSAQRPRATSTEARDAVTHDDRASTPSTLPVAVAGPGGAPSHVDAPVRRDGPPWRAALGALWLAGLGVALARVTVRSVRFARALRGATPLADGPAVDSLTACAAASGVRRPVGIATTDLVRTPAVHGVRRPLVLVPPGLLERLSPDELRLVLHHELAHVRCHDAAVNWALALVRSVFWFHPVVAWSLGRLDAERETARDWMALTAAGAHDARAAQDYGHALLRVLDVRRPGAAPAGAVALFGDRNDLKRRITMLANFRPATRRGLLLGGALLTALGCATLTSGPAAPVFGQDTGRTDDADHGARPAGARVTGPVGTPVAPLRRVHVVRQRTVPAWETKLRTRLERTFDADFHGTLAEALALVRTTVGVNLIADRASMGSALEDEVEIRAEAISGTRFLDWALRGTGLAWCPSDGAVYVAGRSELPLRHERRYYNVRALLREAADPVEDEDDEPYLPTDELVDLVRVLIAPESWDEDGANITPWNGLLVVDAVPDVHDGVEGLLNLLLNRGRRPALPEPSWNQALQKRLDASVDFRADEMTFQDAAVALGKTTGVSIALSRGVELEREVSLELTGVPARQVLAWLARLGGAHVVVRDGGVVLQEAPPMVYRCYAVRDVLEQELGGRDGLDDLTEIIQASSGGASWIEFEGPGVYRWADFLIISQSEPVHAEIEEVLGALRTVFRTD